MLRHTAYVSVVFFSSLSLAFFFFFLLSFCVVFLLANQQGIGLFLPANSSHVPSGLVTFTLGACLLVVPVFCSF